MPRIQHLRNTPATIRFLSIEPLLEDLGTLNLDGIHWVIVGGESGFGARPMHRAWVMAIKDQCDAQGSLFFFKQWGGVQKAKNGRRLNGRTYDEMPPQPSKVPPDRLSRSQLLRDLAPLERASTSTQLVHFRPA